MWYGSTIESAPATAGSTERRHIAAALAALFAAYFAAGWVGLRLDPVSGLATLVWPPTGIALFALWRGGPRLWPAVFGAAWLLNVTFGAPALAAIGVAAGNTLEPLVAVWLLRRVELDPALGRARDVVALTATVVLTPLIAATVGVGCLWAGGPVTRSAAPVTWLTWWVGDGLGALVFAPLLWLWTSRLARASIRSRPIEAALATACLLVAASAVFGPMARHIGLPGSPLDWTYILFPVLVWAALRFHQLGAISAAFAVSVVAIIGTARGHGPYAVDSLRQSLLLVEGFAGVATVTLLVLGATAADNARLYAQAQADIQTRENFLSIASHELRNPLASLVVLAERLRSGVHRPDSPASGTSSAVETVERQTQRLTGLVDNLVAVSHLMAGRFDLQPEPLDLAQLVSSVVDRSEPALSRAGCPIELVLDQQPCTGQWDRLRLELIVANLVTNAAKHGRGTPIRIHLQATVEQAVLRVTDQGPGIDKGDQQRIFERFERAVHDGQASGSGLGLWITYQAVTAMGGTIDVSSASGHGSTFIVSLPRAGQAAPASGASMV